MLVFSSSLFTDTSFSRASKAFDLRSNRSGLVLTSFSQKKKKKTTGLKNLYANGRGAKSPYDEEDEDNDNNNDEEGDMEVEREEKKKGEHQKRCLCAG